MIKNKSNLATNLAIILVLVVVVLGVLFLVSQMIW